MSCAAPSFPVCSDAVRRDFTSVAGRRQLLSCTASLSLHASAASHKALALPMLGYPSSRSSPSTPRPVYSSHRLSCCRAPDGHCTSGHGEESLNLLKDCARALAVVIVGSVLFAGRFACRPALAATDVQRGTAGAPAAETAPAPKEVGNGDEEEEDEEEEVVVDEELAERMLDANPRDVKALKMTFYAKMKKGKIREAVDYVERLIKVEPEEVEWRLLQALCYELMGRFSKAKQLFKDILEKRPLLIRALHGLALVMHKNHEGPAVYDMLNEALELAHREKRVTEERNIRILISQMHVLKGDFEEGLKQFKSLIDENNGDLEGGLVLFQKLAEENPKDFRPYLCQGIIYSLLDKKQEAEEQFEIYRSLIPDEFPQRNFLDDVILSAKSESQGQSRNDFRSE